MNETKVVTWLCVLWMLPQEVFTVPGRTRGGKAGRKFRHHRIHHALNDAELLGRLAARAEEGADLHPAQQSSSPACAAAGSSRDGDAAGASPLSLSPLSSLPLSAEVDAACHSAAAPANGGGAAAIVPTDSSVALRVEHLFRLGHVQRAMRSLVSTTGKATWTRRLSATPCAPCTPRVLASCRRAPATPPSWSSSRRGWRTRCCAATRARRQAPPATAPTSSRCWLRTPHVSVRWRC